MAQEGNILNGPPIKRLDMKGLQLRKSSLNKNIREFFTNTLLDKILVSDKINLAEVYKDFENMENIIKNSLLSGSMEYCQLGKVNQLDKYVEPLTQQTVRGTLLWNAFFSENPIMPPEKINYLKLKKCKYVDFLNTLDEENKDKIIKLYDKYSKVGTKELADYEISIICLPKSVKKIPDFLIKYIDIDSMVHDQIKAAMEILVPLGFKSLDIIDKSYATNIINI